MSDDLSNYRVDEVRRKYDPAINGRMTFAGAFLKYFYIRPDENTRKQIKPEGKNSSTIGSIYSRSVSDTTLMEYVDEVIDRILPVVDPHNMTMEDYTLTYFEDALERIKRNNPTINDISSYRRHIRRIYNAWADHNEVLTGRIIWPEDKRSFHTETSINKRKKLHTRPRSLGIQGEIEMFKWYASLNVEAISNTDLGILLMFFLGLRNNEAAARTFGDIRRIEGTQHHCIYVLTSTKRSSKELKVGGKTSNAFRIIPLYDFFYDFLKKRRDYLVSRWKDENSKLSDKEIDERISAWRIASTPSDNEGVSSPNLTMRGKEVLTLVLSKCHNPQREVSYKDVEYDFSYGLQERGIEDEDSATTYLFRRNFATHLVNLGFDPSQVEYLIGHEIEENGVLRHFFSTGEELVTLAKIMQEHPFCLLNRILHNQEIDDNNYQDRNISLHNISKEHPGHIRLITSEPFDDVTIETEQHSMITASVTRYEFTHGYHPTMNIRQKMLQVYKKRAKEYLDADNNKSQSDCSM